MADIEDARAKMIAKRFGGDAKGASTGGGGSVRRKKKTAHKTPSSGVYMRYCDAYVRLFWTSDDKKLGSTLKKLGVSGIPGIEEVNLFKENGEVIHFVNPKGIIIRYNSIDLYSASFHSI